MSNRTANYYKEIGGYRGAIKRGGRWMGVHDTRRISKVGIIRWQGPPSIAIQKAMNVKLKKEVVW